MDGVASVCGSARSPPTPPPPPAWIARTRAREATNRTTQRQTKGLTAHVCLADPGPGLWPRATVRPAAMCREWSGPHMPLSLTCTRAFVVRACVSASLRACSVAGPGLLGNASAGAVAMSGFGVGWGPTVPFPVSPLPPHVHCVPWAVFDDAGCRTAPLRGVDPWTTKFFQVGPLAQLEPNSKRRWSSSNRQRLMANSLLVKPRLRVKAHMSFPT